MGKPAKQPRQKGNLKPASSSRAADLAGGGGGISGSSSSASFGTLDLGGFAQFAGPSVAGFSMPTLSTFPAAATATAAADTDAMTYATSLDSELVVILKKLAKRDSITKFKALEEMEAYLRANTDGILSVISTWARLYAKLTMDIDRRVRLATNHVHYLVATYAKKKLGPHLKEFIGPWILTFFDPSADVAKSARETFEAVFSEDKRQNVLKVCQKDILDYLTEILLYKTPETLSDPRHVSKEEMAAKFARVIAGCFYTLSYLLDSIPLEELEKYTESYNGLLDNPTLWKFMSHESPMIRKAIYNFMKLLSLRWKETLAARLDTVCPAFFASVLKEKEYSAFADMWDALLLLTKEYPEAWLVAGKKKPVMPKFYNFLRGGLNGAASVGYPSILVLLANYPPQVRNAPKFYESFFTSFWDAASSDVISKSNSAIFVNAYAECIVYAAIHLNTGDKAGEEEEQKNSNNSYLVETAFGGLITSYLSGILGDKLDSNISDIIAKHFITLASAERLNDFTARLISQTERYLIQTVMDCAQPSGRAIVMDIFAQNTTAFLISLRTHMNNAVGAKGERRSAAACARIEDWARRLIPAALGSSLIYKDKSPQLLQMANDLLRAYWASFTDPDSGMKEIIRHAKLLLTVLNDIPEKSLGPFVSLYMNLITRLGDTAGAKELCSAMLSNLAEVDNSCRQADMLILLLDQIKRAPSVTRSYSGEHMDAIFTKLAINYLHDESPTIGWDKLQHLILTGLQVHFASALLSMQVMEKVATTFHGVFEKLDPYQSGSASAGAPALSLLHRTLCILNVLKSLSSEQLEALIKIPAAIHIPVGVFELIFAKFTSGEGLDHGTEAEAISKTASEVWKSLGTCGVLTQAPVLDALLAHARRTIADVHHHSSPSDSVERVKTLLNGTYDTDRSKVISKVFGHPDDWRQLRARFGQYTSTKFLGVSMIDPYASLVDVPLVESDEIPPVAYDMYGLSSYARMLLFVAEYILGVGVPEFFAAMDDEKDWILHQLMVASVECQWGLAIPGSYPIWDSTVAASSLGIQAFVNHTEMIFHQRLDMLVRSRTTQGVEWSDALYDFLMHNKATGDDPLARFIGETIRSPCFGDDEDEKKITVTCAAAARALEMVLKRTMLLVGYSSDSLQRWLTMLKAEARTVRLPFKVAILDAFKNTLDGSAQYERLQSELTSKLSGVRSFDAFGEDADKEAWYLVVLLNASSLAFGAISIPPQRLTHLLLAVRKWFEDDSVVHDFVPSHRMRVLVQLAKLFAHLAESVQDVSGGQWDFFLERSYEWIKYSDPGTDEELPILYYALKLYSKLKTLSTGGEHGLSSALEDHEASFYELILELFATEKGSSVKTKIHYQQLLSDLLQNIPQKIVVEAQCIPKLFGLLFASNEIVQKRALELLKVYTSHIVQAASVRLEFTSTADDEDESSSSSPTAAIQADLLRNILMPPGIPKWHSAPLDEQPLHEVSGYLFSWLIMFEHFVDITFRLKQEYTTQLKEHEAVTVLLPFLSTLLGIGVGGADSQAFSLSLWCIESYDCDGFDGTAEISYQLLAAHVFYLALKHIPSLVRQWWADCKTRQLTIEVERYVEQNYSAMLIERELRLVNREDIKSMLEENDNENHFAVKALRTAHEVSATYTVDEQNMQIAIRLPSNFPLRQIEVEGVQKVGVNDKQWRGWMFSVAAVIGSQNGSIVDALTVFKRNLNLHFSGVEDCTICYSIISAQDRSIPTKQCRTCKNKFHSSCLYKWFRSSNSASCPLCRTVF
ncbi:hypothetical protein BX666DRAFT_2004897 [Dichotomocladium elegans]|nr:hypothetical protein BX666DRAFT_2004897 [Dichotomocladium elegans]